MSAVENTIFVSVAASAGDRRPSRLASRVSNCAFVMGAWVLSLSPAKAASGSSVMTAAAINELETFMNSPEHWRKVDAGRARFTRAPVIVSSLIRPLPLGSRPWISALAHIRDIDQAGDVDPRQPPSSNYNRSVGCLLWRL